MIAHTLKQGSCPMHLRSVAALIVLLAIGNAMAEDGIHGLQSKQEFVAMKASVLKDISDGKRFKEIKADDQKTLITALNRMDERWQHVDDGGLLAPQARVEMANDQELVANIIQHAAADSRVVCQRSEPIGSHMPHNVCKTVAQMRREQEKAQDSMRLNGATSN